MVVSICQSILVCQVLFTSSSGIYTIVPGGGRGRSICWSILVCQVLSTSSQCICAIVSGGGGPSTKVYLSAKFYLIVVKRRHVWSCSVEGGALFSTLCSSDKFCLVVCNSSLCNWFLGGHFLWYIWVFLCIQVILCTSVGILLFIYYC